MSEIVQPGDLEKTNKLFDAKERIAKSTIQMQWLIVAISAILALYCGIITIDYPPWYPPQNLAVVHQPPTTAYILSESGTEIAVLIASTKQLKYYKISEVISHEPCSQQRFSSAYDTISPGDSFF